MSTVVWKPNHPHKSQMWAFLECVNKKHRLHFTEYHELYAWSIKAPQAFWQLLCEFFHLEFDTPPTEILSSHQHMLDAKWFAGATFNFAEKLLKRQDDFPALITLNEQGDRQVMSYKELGDKVAACALSLKELGIGVGDRVVAILPNVAITVVAMLATTSLGAIWSSCSPDFGAQAIIDRFSQIEPKILFAGNGHRYLGKTYEARDKIQEVMKAIPSLQHLIICPIISTKKEISSPKEILWDNFLQYPSRLSFTALPFDHPLYILFSSGTTGKPKCIVHGAGGTLLQHIKELALHTDIGKNDNLCFYTTCGWMMWNWMVSVLALGATLTLYEGSPTYPTAKRLFQIIEEEGVTVFGTSAKFISSIQKLGIIPHREFRLTQLRAILSTGSPLLPKNYDFIYDQVKADIQLSSISGGTDIISCFALGNPLLPVYRGELQSLGLGMAVTVFDETGHPVQQKQGELVCTQAFPSMPLYFWNDPHKERYKKAYFSRFPNVWSHGDFAEFTSHKGLIIYGRSDTLLNPGGVRIGTAEIYRQVEKIPEIVDSVVIGQNWQDDVRIVLFVQLKEGIDLNEKLKTIIQQTIRYHASPRHVPAKIVQVEDIPRTMSGKTMELVVKQLVHGEELPNVEALANPGSLKFFKNRKELND